MYIYVKWGFPGRIFIKYKLLYIYMYVNFRRVTTHIILLSRHKFRND